MAHLVRRRRPTLVGRAERGTDRGHWQLGNPRPVRAILTEATICRITRQLDATQVTELILRRLSTATTNMLRRAIAAVRTVRELATPLFAVQTLELLQLEARTGAARAAAVATAGAATGQPAATFAHRHHPRPAPADIRPTPMSSPRPYRQPQRRGAELRAAGTDRRGPKQRSMPACHRGKQGEAAVGRGGADRAGAGRAGVAHRRSSGRARPRRQGGGSRCRWPGWFCTSLWVSCCASRRTTLGSGR